MPKRNSEVWPPFLTCVWFFVLSFENNAFRLLHTRYERTYEKRSRRWLHNWFLLDYPYFKKVFKMITIDQSKQQAFDADPKAIQ